jgi:hypothetical protein
MAKPKPTNVAVPSPPVFGDIRCKLALLMASVELPFEARFRAEALLIDIDNAEEEVALKRANLEHTFARVEAAMRRAGVALPSRG